jgi:hypothetical protein
MEQIEPPHPESGKDTEVAIELLLGDPVRFTTTSHSRYEVTLVGTAEVWSRVQLLRWSSERQADLVLHSLPDISTDAFMRSAARVVVGEPFVAFLAPTEEATQFRSTRVLQIER